MRQLARVLRPSVCHSVLSFFLLLSTAKAAAPTISAVAPANLPPGATVTVTVDGTGFTSSSKILINGTAATTTYVSATRLTASVPVQPAPGAMTIVGVSTGTSFAIPRLVRTEPASPRVGYGAAVRFLEQAAFGPDPQSVARVQQIGFAAWLDEQLAMNRSTYPASTSTAMNLTPVQQRFFTNIIAGEDQLRQRVAFALSQMFVISGYKTFSPQQVMPYLQLLQDRALGNYADLLRAVTLSPAMGLYLDMVNNSRSNSLTGAQPNENYGREVLQLFSIGPDLLNLDGTPKRGADGKPLPAYSQDTIAAFARAFTGWTYAPQMGQPSKINNPPNYDAPMQASETLHDTDSKTLLNGAVLPAGQTAAADLEDALDNIFRHPNVGPFLAERLIKALVTSNPSPGYVARIATVFNSSSGVRGDLRAVVRAILLDPEARAGDPPNTPAAAFGHLREPVLYIAAAVRGAGGTVQTQNLLASFAGRMDQMPFYPNSVFGFYSPDYIVPRTTLTGPEFQIFYPSSAVARTNFAQSLTFGPSFLGVDMNKTRLESLRGDPETILEYFSRCYLRGQMTEPVKAAIRPAILDFHQSSVLPRAQTALFLTISSPYFEVQQ